MVDILFTAHNRPEFTRASLDALYKNTNWGLVRGLHVYDDNSDDETQQVLAYSFAHRYPKHGLFTGKYGGPVFVMQDFIRRMCSQGGGFQVSDDCPAFCKVDSDTIVPPGWLDTCLATMEQFPRVDLLGIEAYGELARTSGPAYIDVCGTTKRPWPECDCGDCERGAITRATMLRPRGVQLTDHIGGIGVFRYRAFKDFAATVQPNRTYFGFTEWQWANERIVKAWLAPALPVFLLDHLPFAPWSDLSKEYVRRGDQRVSWGEYSPECSGLWDWWVK